ncbi:DUF6886 family protein [Lacrimispora indolis]|uniref:DUF6886 family protein n=1 Tax=Lacrimispora indolis TaxID=69825 RepID=UPI00346087CD
MRQVAIAKYTLSDLFAALFEKNVELRVVKNLWDISDRIKGTALKWSICRMGYAQPRM